MKYLISLGLIALSACQPSDISQDATAPVDTGELTQITCEKVNAFPQLPKAISLRYKVVSSGSSSCEIIDTSSGNVLAADQNDFGGLCHVRFTIDWPELYEEISRDETGFFEFKAGAKLGATFTSFGKSSGMGFLFAKEECQTGSYTY